MKVNTRNGYEPNTPERVRSAFNNAVGRRRRVTVRGEGPFVRVVESDVVVSRCVFLRWRRLGWLTDGEFERHLATYHVPDLLAEHA